MNAYQRALRDLQDYAEDVFRSRHQTFEDAVRRFASVLVPGTPFGDVIERLPSIDFDAWLQERRTTVRGMVGSGELRWPNDKGERLALQVALLRKLASGELDLYRFTHDFVWAGNRLDDHVSEFVQQMFRPFVRDFLRFAHDVPEFEQGLRASTETRTDDQRMSDLDLFISHSSADANTAKAVISLYEKGLKLSARGIRCTSVDGYRLPGGADTNEVLRTEVFGARLFIALLTPTSLASPYVLFELGARWGARKPLVPLLAGGTTAGDLQAPLNGLNALSASVANQVRQLIEESSTILAKELEPLASFSSEVDALVAASAA